MEFENLKFLIQVPGLYFHIPFCRRACHYCNFHFSTSLARKDEMINAMMLEFVRRSENITGKPNIVETIYFGGGTPSLLSLSNLSGILNLVREHFVMAPDVEITLEANPDDITHAALYDWKHIGINRLSIGVQSFGQDDLVWMNRAHNDIQAIDALKLAKQSGFDNFSVDLIFGTPTLSDSDWKRNVDVLINSVTPHIAAYALTVEPSTALDLMIRNKKKEMIDPGKQAAQFLMLIEWLEQAGYEHYEISNFCKPGKRSRHNTSYWKGIPYIGIGPSAHSYDGATRSWNVSNNTLYLKKIKNKEIAYEEEILSNVQRLNEYIMTSLRTMEGIDLSKVENLFGKNYADQLMKGSQKYLNNQNISLENKHLRLTRPGKLFADGITADLFFTSKET